MKFENPQNIADFIWKTVPVENQTESTINSAWYKVTVAAICRAEGRQSWTRKTHQILIEKARESEHSSSFNCHCGFTGKLSDQCRIEFKIQARTFCNNCGTIIKTEKRG